MDESGKHIDPVSGRAAKESVTAHEGQGTNDPDSDADGKEITSDSETATEDQALPHANAGADLSHDPESGVEDPQNFAPEPRVDVGEPNPKDSLTGGEVPRAEIRDRDFAPSRRSREAEIDAEEDDLFDLFGDDFEASPETEPVNEADDEADRADPANEFGDATGNSERMRDPAWDTEVRELLEDVSDSGRGDDVDPGAAPETESGFESGSDSRVRAYETGQYPRSDFPASADRVPSAQGFAHVLREEESDFRGGGLVGRKPDSRALPNTDDRDAGESPGKYGVFDAERDLDEDPRVTIGSAGVDPETAENEKRDRITPTVGNPGRYDRGQKPENSEGGAMRWLPFGIALVFGILLVGMGVFVLDLKSRIDGLEARLDSGDEPFGTQVLTPNDLANEAVIENINARIDNLADTLELIANANQRDTSAADGSMPLGPGSATSEPGAPDTGNRTAAVLAGREEINQINQKLTGLDQSLAEVDHALAQLGQKIQALETSSAAEGSMAVRRSDAPVTTEPVQRAQKPLKPEAALASGTQPSSNASVPVAAKPPHRTTPQAPRKTAPKGSWSVNLMSFPNRTTAQQELEKIRKKGVPAKLERAVVSGKTWYRIRVKGFQSKQEAQKYAQTVAKKLGLASTWVTR